MAIPRFFALLGISILILGCSGNDSTNNTPNEQSWIYPKYAKGFKWRTDAQGIDLVILKPWPNTQETLTYRLSNEIAEKETRTFRVPIKKLAATSTSHLPMLDALGTADRLIAFAQTDLITNQTIRERIRNEQVFELGTTEALNLEKLMASDIDLLTTFVMDPSAKNMHRMEQLGIPVLVNGDYLETTPLGRAEWIKVFGMLMDKQKMADSVFYQIEDNYLQLKQLASESADRPTVFSNLMYSDVWYMPGGNSYPAGFLTDAQANYLWSNDTSRNSLPLSYETVLTKAGQADYWIGVANNTTKEQLLALNENYSNFSAFQKGNVYHYHKRVGESGGNEYLEEGFLRPDLILKDLIKILHPQLLPEHELYFYGRLE